MTDPRLARVVVDAMGGDHAPTAILAGIDLALQRETDVQIIVAGDSSIVEEYCASRMHCAPLITTETIAMDEHPAQAVRSKKDSSIVAGCRMVKTGDADAFFSAGSTGACMAASTLVMGRIKGVARPAIATVIPTGTEPVILLDVGANADCKPEHLSQFAHMGIEYAKTILGIEQPRVGLLNIGEEPTKGSVLAQEAYELMEGHIPGFIGNVEGRDITTGVVDVIVTDGFTGNVALKLLEGVSRSLLGQVKTVMLATFTTRLAALTLKPGLTALKDKLDPDTYGGAPLLGVNGVSIIGHGSSGEQAVSAAISVAAQAVRGGLTASIAESLED